MTLRRKALWLSILLIIPLIAAALPVRDVKAHPTKVYIEPASIIDTSKTPGTQFSVDIMVDAVTDLYLFEFELTFNPDVIRGVWYDAAAIPPLPVEIGTWLGSAGGIAVQNAGMGWNNTIGKLWLTGAYLILKDAAHSPDTTTPQVLAIVTFEVVGKGETDIRLGELTGLMDPYDNYIIKGRDYVEDGYFRNIDSAEIPTASFTATPVGTPSEQGPLEGYNTELDGSASTAPGSKTITTRKWYFWKILHQDYYGWFPSGQLPNVTSQITVTRNFTRRGTWPITLTVIDDAGVVGTTTVNVQIRAHDVYFDGITTNSLQAVYPSVPYVNIGETLQIDVNAKNEGDFQETFDVSCLWSFFDESAGKYVFQSIGKQSGVTLGAGANQVITFNLNTDGYNLTHPQTYEMSANASVVPYEYDKEMTAGHIAANQYGPVEQRVRFHDIAITTLKPTTKTVTATPEQVKVNVTVVNQGDFDEKQISVTTYYNNTLIGTQTVHLLTNSSYGKPPNTPQINHTAVVRFDWDTTGIQEGLYIISAEASVVPAEYDVSDNAYGRPYREMVPHHAINWEGVDYYVGIVSDSTVSDFQFSKEDHEIRFNVTGDPGMKGYCTVAIPKGLLWGTYTISLNGTLVDYTIAENVTHYFIYFTYEFESFWNVTIWGPQVVPEFSEAIILPLIVVATLIAIVLGKSRSKRPRGPRGCSIKQAKS